MAIYTSTTAIADCDCCGGEVAGCKFCGTTTLPPSCFITIAGAPLIAVNTSQPGFNGVFQGPDYRVINGTYPIIQGFMNNTPLAVVTDPDYPYWDVVGMVANASSTEWGHYEVTYNSYSVDFDGFIVYRCVRRETKIFVTCDSTTQYRLFYSRRYALKTTFAPASCGSPLGPPPGSFPYDDYQLWAPNTLSPTDSTDTTPQVLTGWGGALPTIPINPATDTCSPLNFARTLSLQCSRGVGTRNSPGYSLTDSGYAQNANITVTLHG